ncbi:MAG TPA: nuclear transport factor 2 family protein [Pyrinomonadaceae bacterium]|nr:nuclear transport factor 2 family protein [Pyrinomonadaceae bacterium]
MRTRTMLGIIFIFSISTVAALAQNSNTSQTVRPRKTTTTTKPSTDSQKSTDEQPPATTQPRARSTTVKPKVAATEPSSSSQTVAGAFNALLNGIRHADVKAVSGVYWNSSRLILFNNNGSVTKGWEQMRANRESSYKEMKDVKLEVRDLSISMLGTTGAVVSCLWTQSQTYKGEPETATGRMTLVFKKVGKDWKAIHLHTSPDRPDQNRVLPSEQTSPAASSSPD